MKLYATTTSERAVKAQGGNDWLEIRITDCEDKAEAVHRLTAKIEVWNKDDRRFLKYQDCMGNEFHGDITKGEKTTG